RYAADVPSVTGGEQRQQADRGMLRRVQATPEVGPRDPGRLNLRFGEGPPYGSGTEMPRWKVERNFAEDLAGDDPFAQVGNDLVSDLDGTEAQPGVPPALLTILAAHADIGDIAGRGGEVGRRGVHKGRRIAEVEVIHEIGVALMQIDGAVVDGRVRGCGVHGAEEAPGRVFHYLHRAGTGAANVGEVA